MWRFYIRHRNNNPCDMPSVQRANWYACDVIYSELPQEDRNIIDVRYAQWPDRREMNRHVQECAAASNSRPLDVGAVIANARRLVAEIRGLKEPDTETTSTNFTN